MFLYCLLELEVENICLCIYITMQVVCVLGCVYPHVLLPLVSFSHASSFADHHEFS